MARKLADKYLSDMDEVENPWKELSRLMAKVEKGISLNAEEYAFLKTVYYLLIVLIDASDEDTMTKAWITARDMVLADIKKT